MRISEETPWYPLLRLMEQDLALRVAGSPGSPKASEAWAEARRRISTYARAVVRTRPGLTSADAEDLAGDLILKLQDRAFASRMVRLGSPAGYFYAVLRNSATDLWRRHNSREAPLEDALTVADPASTASQEECSALVERLQSELALLTEQERQ